MPDAGGFIEAGGEPGRVPVMLGSILALLAMVLMGRSVAHLGRSADQPRPDWYGWWRSALVALGCSLYAVGLLGGGLLGVDLPYRLATALFVFLFIAGFEWPQATELGNRRWRGFSTRFPAAAGALARRRGFIPRRWLPYLWLLTMALLQALAVAYGVAYLFEQQLYVQLP